MTRRPSPRRSRRSTRPCTACPACSPWPTATTSSPGSRARLDQLDAYAAAVDAALADGSAAAEPTRSRRRAPRRSGCATRCGRSAATGCAPPREVDALAGRDASVPARAGYLAIQQALSAIDRLEVRGRDSAGLHVFVWDHDLDLDDPAVAADLAARGGDPLFQSGSARAVPNGSATVLSFVYKAAAEIGELGDNTAAMRAAVAGDHLLRLALTGRPAPRSPCSATPAGPASASSREPNAHPVNSDEMEQPASDAGRTSSACSTATSTTTPTSRSSTGCASPARSPPTPR